MKQFSIVGKDVPRNDARAKATGSSIYTDDIKLPGMLHGRLLRSPFPHARIVHIDTSRAVGLPGVKCVLTGEDTPKIKYGNWRLFPDTQDEYPLTFDKVRFVGDEVAAVAAIDLDTAEEALSLIRVDYEELPSAFDIESSLKEGAPVIHDYCPTNISVNRKIHYGDVERAFAESDYVRQDSFTVHAVSPAYLEPCSAIAQSDLDGRITLWTSTQVPYIIQCLLASTLNMRENDVRVIKPTVGGGFGGKMELRAWEFCAAFMAKKTGRPVKFTLTREEELMAGRRRHGMKLTSKVGFKKDGTLTAKDLRIHLDGGAYNAMGPTATFLCGTFGAMLYRYPNYRFLGEHVYTNKPPASAMRGFGAPQSIFATETQMNIAAEALGIDPIELRIKNAQVTGDQIPDVATISSCGFIEALQKVTEMSDWKEKRKNFKKGQGIGIGCYSFISGGVFNWFNTQYPFSAAEVRVFDDGTAHLLTMAADIGQGCDTALKQILAEELGIGMADIRITSADTAITPQADLGAWGSRLTLMNGNAVIDAARKIKVRLFGSVSAKLNLNVIHELVCRDGKVFPMNRPDRGVSLGEAVALTQKFNRGEPVVERGYYTPRNKGMVTPAFSFGAQVSEVEVDSETGIVQVKKFWTAHDCGTVINQKAVEGQLEGSLQMGLGYALSEQFIMEGGKTLNTNFLDYKMPNAMDVPPSEVAHIDTFEPDGPLGAKEAGEGLAIPTAPCIADAVWHATGFRCKDLPITPEKILNGTDCATARAASPPAVVDLDIQGEIAFITINRPKALNALNEAVIDQLEKRFSEAESNAAVKGIVFQGAGKAFVAGADIRFFVEKIKAGRVSDIEAFTRRTHELFLKIEDSRKKTIALLDGLSLGGGSELALACQQILATPAGSMGLPETGIGIFPGLGGMLRFAKQVGTSLAKYYTFTGTSISAADAHALGVVTVLSSPEDVPKTLSAMIAGGQVEKYRTRDLPEAFIAFAKTCDPENIEKLLTGQPLLGVSPELAARTAKTVRFKGPLALKMADEIIDRQAALTLQEGVELELSRLCEIFSTADALEGLSSVLESRRPSFKGV